MLQYCDKIISPEGKVTALEGEEKEDIRVKVIEHFASQGLRTICLAYGDFPPQNDWEEPPEHGLICLGIVGIKVNRFFFIWCDTCRLQICFPKNGRIPSERRYLLLSLNAKKLVSLSAW